MCEQGKDWGITLYSPEDKIYGTGGFSGRTFPMGNFGNAKIIGYREPNGSGHKDHGVALLNGQLIFGTEDKFMKMGFSQLEILLKFPGEVKI